MIHQASISCSELVRKDCATNGSLTEQEKAARMLRYNAFEFRDLIKHISTQTEGVLHELGEGSSSISTDAMFEVEVESVTIAALREEIRRVYQLIHREKERSGERERILIAQMNALRESELDHRMKEKLVLRFIIPTSAIDCERIPFESSIVWYSVNLVEVGDSAQVISVGVSDDGRATHSKITFPDTWTSVQVSRLVGNVYFEIILFAKSDDATSFEVVLGRWVSPQFIPALKERGRSVAYTAHLGLIGALDIELTIVFLGGFVVLTYNDNFE